MFKNLFKKTYTKVESNGKVWLEPTLRVEGTLIRFPDTPEYRKLIETVANTKFTGRVYNAEKHNGWGNRITLEQSGNGVGTFTGNGASFTSDRNEFIQENTCSRQNLGVGDEIRIEMASGNIGRHVVTKVKYEKDPIDFFSGEALIFGYVEII